MEDVSQTALDMIKRFEGFSGEKYYCPAGKLTIGYGHVIAPEEYFPDSISQQEAESILKQDVNAILGAFLRLVKVETTQNQQDALLSLAYNIGIKAFEKSTLLRLLNAGDAEGAARQFDRWVYIKGVKSNGLANRRATEKAWFLGEETKENQGFQRFMTD
jgi:lysozyme